MAKNTTTLSARIDGMETRMDGMEGALGRIEAILSKGVPTVTPEAPTKASKASKASKPKAKKADEGLPFAQLRFALKQHKVAGRIVAGVTVKDAIAGGLMDNHGRFVGADAPAVVAKAEPKAKAKATRAPEPEFGTEAWIAWARPTEKGAPRRADGSVTPKAEWAIRFGLIAKGKYTPEQVDRKVAKRLAREAQVPVAEVEVERDPAEVLREAGFSEDEIAKALVKA